ncbi:MAG: TIR domain-containing protein, partial [Leptolyngbya sp. SIO3F4]|nr:TIR domain-containing protein [Leptolyngbya sp. SIO3F4]
MPEANAVFISYRRSDSNDVTGRIYDFLSQHFGPDVVFKDVESIPLGVDYRVQLNKTVGRCQVLVAVIGPTWLQELQERLERPDDVDWVRLELETALEREIPIIPLRVGGAELPSVDELPESLQDFPYRNAGYARPDPDFRPDMNRLIRELEDIVGIPTGLDSSASANSSTLTSLTSIPSNLRERGSTTFVGRDDTLKKLHEQLQTNQTLAITALQGMGGIGKTEMAVQYAQRYKEHYPSGVCWLSARGAEVGTQIVKFAVEALGLPQPEGELDAQLQFVWGHWPRRPEGDRVLLIYDDVADQESADGQQIKAYDALKASLPSDKRFQVLLTTRLQNLAAGVEDFRLELLSETAALQLLEAIVGNARIDGEKKTAQALCERVGYLPLGIELLGYFLKNKPRMSLEKLQQRLKKNRLNAKAFQTAHPGMTAKLGVYEAFELSWNELSEAGQEMACWLSLFGLAPIPWGLASAEVPEEDEDDWEDTRDDELLKLSLLQDLDGDSYQLHQLVR